eukprot:7426930-Pyramimonas_sp.AAC.1
MLRFVLPTLTLRVGVLRIRRKFYGEDIARLIERMLEMDASKRPTMRMLLDDPWVKVQLQKIAEVRHI